MKRLFQLVEVLRLDFFQDGESKGNAGRVELFDPVRCFQDGDADLEELTRFEVWSGF